uniref:Uncharacterized protein n=1 Tax=Plectus sambesii TaxID=2011161 RepID=A0A914VZY4_9BILA
MASRFTLTKNVHDSDMTLEYSITDPSTGDATTIVKHEHKDVDGTIVQKKTTSITKTGTIPIKIRRQSTLGSFNWIKNLHLPWNSKNTARRLPDTSNVPKFDEIRRTSIKFNTLWEDSDFLAVDESIFFSRRSPRPFVWKRPHELCANPQFVYKDFSRFDVVQGELGDCWLLAAIANVTLYPNLFKTIIYKEDQSFKKDYTGAFHFQFWQYGHWVDVVVDDRLPTYDGKLVFMHSADNDEFWSALLEKAYAKLNGSYEALMAGSTSEAMEDFTGGLCEMFEMRDPPKDLFSIMLKANERQSLMGGSVEADPYIFEARESNGLVRGHAYSITDVKMVNVTLPSGGRGLMQLLRLRNPWGNASEWNGAWSDRSLEWYYVTEEEKVELGLVSAADGEFWISFHDFVKNFEKLEICHLSPEAAAYAVGAPNQSWACNNFEGVWTKNSTAGGCRNYLNTFAHNPQYHMKLTLADDDADNVCTCIIALLQKNRRLQRLDSTCEMLTIGFAMYRVEDEKLLAEPLTREFFRTHQSAARSHAFINIREVCTRFRLPAGNYVVIPSTFEPNEEGEFMLRTFSEKPIKAENVDYDTKYQPVVPVLTVEGMDEVEREDRFDQFFETLAGLDLEIDAWELQKIATFALKKEFKELWRSIRVWKSSFKVHDADENGTISAFELGNALRDAGYTLPTQIIRALSLRYANHDGQITFDGFISCAVKLKTMMEIFQERDPKKTGEAKFNLEAWLELTMYA